MAWVRKTSISPSKFTISKMLNWMICSYWIRLRMESMRDMNIKNWLPMSEKDRYRFIITMNRLKEKDYPVLWAKVKVRRFMLIKNLIINSF